MKDRFAVNCGTGITHASGKHYVEIWRNEKPWFMFEFGRSLFTAIDLVRQLNGGSPEWSFGLIDRYSGNLVAA